MYTFQEAAQANAWPNCPEIQLLAQQECEGIFVPADYEEDYYRDVNLPENLAQLFREINPARLDEDQLEGLCIKAQEMVRTSVLLDNAVQRFYLALSNAGLARGELHIRRPCQQYTEHAPRVIPPGMAALHAVKRLWSSDWSFEAVVSRLDATGQIGLEAQPMLIMAGAPGKHDSTKAKELGIEVALVNETGLVGGF